MKRTAETSSASGQRAQFLPADAGDLCRSRCGHVVWKRLKKRQWVSTCHMKTKMKITAPSYRIHRPWRARIESDPRARRVGMKPAVKRIQSVRKNAFRHPFRSRPTSACLITGQPVKKLVSSSRSRVWRRAAEFRSSRLNRSSNSGRHAHARSPRATFGSECSREQGIRARHLTKWRRATVNVLSDTGCLARPIVAAYSATK